MPDWAIAILKTNGLAGVFIFVLLLSITAMAKMLLAKDKQLKVLHEQRAQERESLVKLMERGIEAQRMMAEATEKRSEMMDKFSAAIMVQANSQERLNDRVAGQAEMFKEKLGDFKHVVDSFGESNRVMSGLVAEVRNLILALGQNVDRLGQKVDSVAILIVPGASRKRLPRSQVPPDGRG